MSTTPPGIRRVGLAAAIYGVFVAGWYLGQPVTPECHVDRAALDRITAEHEAEPSPGDSRTLTAYAVACTNDTGERSRVRAWFEGQWR